MARLQQHYKEVVVDQLMKRFEYKSAMEVPKITKITLNMGLGEATGDKKILEHAMSDMEKIAGQKSVKTLARKSIAGFKIREEWPIGCKVTLRKQRMYEFLDRLINIALPRVRDFRGMSAKAFDGPGAGVHGGKIVAQGTPEVICNHPDSLTGQYISGRRAIHVPSQRTPFDTERLLSVEGASGNNLKNVTVHLPVGLLTCITGVSGSGKSTLINDTLYRHAARVLNGATGEDPAPFTAINGLDHFDKIVDIDQSPIGRTPRSNPATYTGLFTTIRELFAGTQEARSRGYKPGRFSFNVKGGRCEACQGDGVIKVEMHFLPDMYVLCDVCKGTRYNRETLEIHYKGKTIYDVLEMTVEDGIEFFAPVPALHRKLTTLADVGLTYIRLGQSATTLSGGEAQRVKLARELSKRDTGRTLYILDEPTTGLHFHDIEQLLVVLHRLRDRGNSVIVIEHNLDVIKTADWIVDIGPEGGTGGGEIITTGTPESVSVHPHSHTGRFLKPLLGAPTRQKDAP